MHISVLQWNIWYKEDVRHIADTILSIDPDIICLQELSTNDPNQIVKDGPGYIAKTLGYTSYVQGIPIDESDGSVYNLANGIFSRFPISRGRTVWINKPIGSGGYDDESRAYLESQIQIKGTVVTVATTHMSYTHAFAETPRKRQEADMLVTALARHKERFIFTGDLNATPGSYTIGQVLSNLSNAGPPLAENTWATKPFSYAGFEETELRWRLDHIFATPDMQLIETRVIQTEYSDHLPILTTFEL